MPAAAPARFTPKSSSPLTHVTSHSSAAAAAAEEVAVAAEKRSRTLAPTPTAASRAATLDPRRGGLFSRHFFLLEQPEAQAELLAPLHETHCTEDFVSTSLAPSGFESRRFLAVVGASSGTIWGVKAAAAIAAPVNAMTAAVTERRCYIPVF
jgi:hypothetical protein